MEFLAQKLFHTINIGFNFVVIGSFFEQDHPQSLIILGVYGKK